MSYSLETLHEYLKTDGAIIIDPLPKLGKGARINFVLKLKNDYMNKNLSI